MEDPFYTVKKEVQGALRQTQTQYADWQRMYSSSPLSEEFKKLTAETKNAIQNIEMDIEDLARTVSIVEKNPQRFNLDIREVQSRKEFINLTKRTMQDMKEGLNSGLSAMANEQRDSLMNMNKPIPDKYAAKKKGASLDNNQSFIDNESSVQQVIMRDQDAQLDGVLNTVSTLKQVALNVGQELDDQVRLLEDVDEQVDHTQSTLKGAMTRMSKVLKDADDKKSFCCIFVLVIILILLLVLIII